MYTYMYISLTSIPVPYKSANTMFADQHVPKINALLFLGTSLAT